MKKGLILSLIIFFLVILTVFILNAGIERVYTHLYYIPIILASMWWQRKGIFLAIGFGAFIITLHYILIPETSIIYDILRSAMFIIIAIIVGELSIKLKNQEKIISETNKELSDTNKKLQTKIEDLEGFFKLTVGREIKMRELKKELADLKKLEK